MGNISGKSKSKNKIIHSKTLHFQQEDIMKIINLYEKLSIENPNYKKHDLFLLEDFHKNIFSTLLSIRDIFKRLLQAQKNKK